MPELPEVETVRRTLSGAVIGLRVSAVMIERAEVIRGDRRPRCLLEGLRLIAALRHGKRLALIGAENGRRDDPGDCPAVGVHLGMSGWLMALREGEAAERSDHVHLRWRLAGAADEAWGEMIFRDPRRFGGVWTYPTFNDLRREHWKGLGPDAASGAEVIAERLLEFKRSNRSLKATLLDQGVLAGVGNIYADEALFDAGLRPQRRMRRVTASDAQRLGLSLACVLEQAIAANGSTVRDYRAAAGVAGAFQASHLVYGRGGRPCARCGGTLRSGIVAQRTTVWCPCCQR